MKLFLVFSVTFGLLAAGPVCSQEPEAFRWQFVPGDVFQVELKQTTGITTNIATRDKQIGNDMLLVMDWKIESVEDDLIVIDQSIVRIYLKINTPEEGGVQTIEVDTDDAAEAGQFGSELLKQVRPLIGTHFKVTMTTRGEINDVDVPRGSMDVIRKAPASMQLRRVLTADGLKELIGQTAIVFPVRAIQPGDSWNESTEIKNALGTFKKTDRYEYRGAGDDGGEAAEFAVDTGIETLVAGENESEIEQFSGSGSLWFSPDENNYLESRFENILKTRRNYRDNLIKTSVTTRVSMKVEKKE